MNIKNFGFEKIKKFSVDLKDSIENGQYVVFTRGGIEAKIISYDRNFTDRFGKHIPIVAQCTNGDIVFSDCEGNSYEHSELYDLYVVDKKDILNNVESVLKEMLDGASRNYSTDNDYLVRCFYDKVMEQAKKRLIDVGEVVDISELPECKHNENGAFGSSDNSYSPDIYLVRVSKGQYRTAKSIGPDTDYLELKDIERLFEKFNKEK